MIETVSNRILYIVFILGSILVGCTAPITDPPAHALPREELRGELDVLNVEQWNDIHHMFLRNQRREQIEQNMTLPVDALNSALEDYWKENGSNDTTEQKELL